MATSTKRPVKTQAKPSGLAPTKAASPRRPAVPRAEAPGGAAKGVPASKRPVRPRAKAPARSPSKLAAPPSTPFLRFYHPQDLRARSLAVLDTLEQAEDSTKHRDALANLVVELTDAGMEYFFLRPLKLAKAGFITEQSARLGMAGSLRVMASVLHNIIGRMDELQLLSVCASIRKLML
jgi:hypothetical protein